MSLYCFKSCSSFLSEDSGADELNLPKLMWFARDKYFILEIIANDFFLFLLN